jgi:hypothetical protein
VRERKVMCRLPSVKRQIAADKAARLRREIEATGALAEHVGEASGVAPNTVRKLLAGGSISPSKARQLRRWLGPDAAAGAPHFEALAPPNPGKSPAPALARSFASDAQRIAYALGALDAAERYRQALGVELSAAVSALSSRIVEGALAQVGEATAPAPEGAVDPVRAAGRAQMRAQAAARREAPEDPPAPAG